MLKRTGKMGVSAERRFTAAVTAFGSRLVEEQPEIKPDFRRLDRLTGELQQIDPALCGLAAPELTGWKNGTTGVTKLYELFGNDYMQDTAVKQPTGVMATKPSGITVNPWVSDSATYDDSVLTLSCGESTSNFQYGAGSFHLPSANFHGAGKYIVSMDVSSNVSAAKLLVGFGRAPGWNDAFAYITQVNGTEVRTLIIDTTEASDNIGLPLDYLCFKLEKLPVNDVAGLTFSISNITIAFMPAEGASAPEEVVLVPQLFFDGSNDELTNTPLSIAFTGYAPVGTPGNSFTISATPTARVAFASVHDAAKQAQVIAALNEAFGAEFEMSAYRVALPDAALFAVSTVAGSSATFDAAEQSWHLQNTTVEGVTLWLSQTVRGEPKLPAGATICLSGRTKGSGNFALYDAAYAPISGNVVTTTDYIDFYQIGGTTYAAAQTACAKRSEKIDRYFKLLVLQKI